MDVHEHPSNGDGRGTSGSTLSAPLPPSGDTTWQLPIWQQKRDLAWQSHRLAERAKNYQYAHCNFCDKLITAGISRLKEHLRKSHKNVAPFTEVPDGVNILICGFLKKSAMVKAKGQRKWNEIVSFGTKDMASCPTPPAHTTCGSSRGDLWTNG